MILGTGIDLTDIRRIEEALQRFGERFENRVFTEAEQKKARSRGALMAATYAKRFAAKEACVKALATRHVGWLDMEVVNLADGVPTMVLHGNAKKHLASITPKGHTSRIFLTMTDAYPFAQAQVILTAEPE